MLTIRETEALFDIDIMTSEKPVFNVEHFHDMLLTVKIQRIMEVSGV